MHLYRENDYKAAEFYISKTKLSILNLHILVVYNDILVDVVIHSKVITAVVVFSSFSSAESAKDYDGGVCCYSKSSGSLLFAETMDYSLENTHGSYSVQTGVNMGIPVFSYWLKETMPFFYCCKWSVNKAQNCPKIWQSRKLSNCNNFSSGKLGKIVFSNLELR